MPSTVLGDTKKTLGLAADYQAFDEDLCVYINGAIAVLRQLGVTIPPDYEHTPDAPTTWADLIPHNTGLRSLCRAYVARKTRLEFDPPSIGAQLNAIQKELEEMVCRINIEAETSNMPE